MAVSSVGIFWYVGILRRVPRVTKTWRNYSDYSQSSGWEKLQSETGSVKGFKELLRKCSWEWQLSIMSGQGSLPTIHTQVFTFLKPSSDVLFKFSEICGTIYYHFSYHHIIQVISNVLQRLCELRSYGSLCNSRSRPHITVFNLEEPLHSTWEWSDPLKATGPLWKERQTLKVRLWGNKRHKLLTQRKSTSDTDFRNTLQVNDKCMAPHAYRKYIRPK